MVTFPKHLDGLYWGENGRVTVSFDSVRDAVIRVPSILAVSCLSKVTVTSMFREDYCLAGKACEQSLG